MRLKNLKAIEGFKKELMRLEINMWLCDDIGGKKVLAEHYRNLVDFCIQLSYQVFDINDMIMGE